MKPCRHNTEYNIIDTISNCTPEIDTFRSNGPDGSVGKASDVRWRRSVVPILHWVHRG